MKIGDTVRGVPGTLLEGYGGKVTGFVGGPDALGAFVYVEWHGRTYASATYSINPSCLEVVDDTVDVRGGRDCDHAGQQGLPVCLICRERLK